jgi:hypothetical protein
MKPSYFIGFLNMAVYNLPTAQFPKGKYQAKNKAIAKPKDLSPKILSKILLGKTYDVSKAYPENSNKDMAINP